MDRQEAIAEAREPLARCAQRRRIAIDADQPPVRGSGLQDRLRVPAASQRGVAVDPSRLRLQRGQDRLGRWGGEEWLLILPGLRPEIVQPLFERLQNEAKAIRVNGIPETRLITFSMGMTTVSGDDKTLDEIVARADEALYEAKAQGRKIKVGKFPFAVLGRSRGLSPTEIAARTAMDKVAVSRAIASLVAAGRVARAAHGNDGRRAVIALSAKGRAVYRQVAPLAPRDALPNTSR